MYAQDIKKKQNEVVRPKYITLNKVAVRKDVINLSLLYNF